MSEFCGPIKTDRRGFKHGLSGVSEYRSWRAMNKRCNCPTATDYPEYGGAGISVCDRWKSFTNFAEDMGPKPAPNYSLDRIDVGGNYEPGNCRWATPTQQNLNQKRTRSILVGGVKITWFEVYKSEPRPIPYSTFTSRMKSGWALEDALSRRSRRKPPPDYDRELIEAGSGRGMR